MTGSASDKSAVETSVRPVERAVTARAAIEAVRSAGAILQPSENANFVHRNMEDRECLVDMGQVQHDYQVWHARMVPEDMRSTLDLEAYAATLAVKTSYSQYTIEKILLAMDLLVHELPTVWAIQQRTWVMSMDYLLTIAPVFDKLSAEEKQQVDPYVAYFLTPQFEQQEWLGPRKLRDLIDDLIHAVLGLPTPVAIEDRKVDLRPTANGNTRVDAVVDPITGQVIEKAIATVQHAAKDPISKAEALRRIVQGAVNVSVRVNAIRADFGEGGLGPVFLPESGFLSQPDIEAWAESVREGKDVTDLNEFVTAAYQFTRDQKDHSVARDELCRFPKCTVKASKCDMDHAVNHADGGPTSLGNNIQLCRGHHMLKTAGAFSYVCFGNGVVWFILPDGSTATSLPTGYQRMMMRTITNIRQYRIDKFNQDLQRQHKEVIVREDPEDIEEKALKIVGTVLGEPVEGSYYSREGQGWEPLAFGA